MIWNWQQADWPHFRYRFEALTALESHFLLQSGKLYGAFKHLNPDEKQSLTIAKFHERFRGAFNERQEKTIARLFEEGPSGFVGGLSAEKYIHITKTSRATATRDLAELVSIGALKKTVQLKSTRYQINYSFSVE